VRVSRSRFVPVKTTGDLVVLWSDVYELTDDYREKVKILFHSAAIWEDRYQNAANADVHRRTTAEEIWSDMNGEVDVFVAGVGTGGTITGTGRYLKERNPDLQVVGADPFGSIYSSPEVKPYLVEGVGEDFWPSTYDKDICDRIVAVSDADSFAMTRRLAREEALLVGGSCGMASAKARPPTESS